jgi:hypothetical protein
MIYKFRLLSDEVEDFRRDIEIDSDATFFDLHKAILAATGYKDDQMTSFFICDDRWEKETEITLEDMGSRSDEDSWIMRETVIGDMVEEEKQRLLYVFDPLADRVFFIELSKIKYGENIDEAKCTKSIGAAPVQTLDFDEIMKKNNAATTSDLDDLDDDFYGSDGYNDDEIDADGFDINDIADPSSFGY